MSYSKTHSFSTCNTDPLKYLPLGADGRYVNGLSVRRKPNSRGAKLPAGRWKRRGFTRRASGSLAAVNVRSLTRLNFCPANMVEDHVRATRERGGGAMRRVKACVYPTARDVHMHLEGGP